jgi:hypothetical protein
MKTILATVLLAAILNLTALAGEGIEWLKVLVVTSSTATSASPTQ